MSAKGRRAAMKLSPEKNNREVNQIFQTIKNSDENPNDTYAIGRALSSNGGNVFRVTNDNTDKHIAVKGNNALVDLLKKKLGRGGQQIHEESCPYVIFILNPLEIIGELSHDDVTRFLELGLKKPTNFSEEDNLFEEPEDIVDLSEL